MRWETGELRTEVERVLDQAGVLDGRAVLRPGARIDKKYEIEAGISSGGSSTIYRAFDWGANRHVALKVLHRAPDDEGYGLRFQREVEVQGNLKHPNLMPIFDHGTWEGRPYYTMELLHKPMSLDAVVGLYRTNRLRYHPSLRHLAGLGSLLRSLVLPVGRAIAFANQNGVIHRDLKPGNILLDAKTLHVYIIDFGICHLFKKT
ncbi:MAG: protein kinase, partial [Planctomycetota bacterium]|nr:protein kinase [Planctomycetota bacterium]